ncbi:Cold shock protein [sediment metagenome]|uniref:Cold shock protein n=1 Tax=sediment metagenome TaxID=749907 RepID=D9PJN0_9ZZZZ
MFPFSGLQRTTRGFRPAFAIRREQGVGHAPDDRNRKILQRRQGLRLHHPDDGGKDIFVHISAVQASGLDGLADGQKVSFDTEPDKRGKGPKAINLSVERS